MTINLCNGFHPLHHSNLYGILAYDTTLLTQPVTFQPVMFGYNHMTTNHIKSISNTFNMHELDVIRVSRGWEVPIIEYFSYAR